MNILMEKPLGLSLSSSSEPLELDILKMRTTQQRDEEIVYLESLEQIFTLIFHKQIS